MLTFLVDSQKVGFFSSLHSEIDRLTSLIYLEGLSHSSGHTLDALTGAADRRSFEDEIVRWITQSKTEGRPFVLAMLDIDDFKVINDNPSYGHPGGDFALKSVAQFLKSEAGPNDFIARCGEKGDEFAILLDASLDQAKQKLGDSLLRLQNEEFEYQIDGQKRPMRIAVSFGLAECGMQDTKEQLTRRADQEMYGAKKRRKKQESSEPNTSESSTEAAG